VEAAGDLVRILIEFSTGVQDGHDDFCGGSAFLWMNINGNAAAVIADGDRAILMNRDGDLRTEARQGLVDGVIHDLEHHVV